MTGSPYRSAVAVLAVVIIGTLAGLYVGTGLAQYSQTGIPYEIWVPRQQAEVGLFKTFMPDLGWAAIIAPALAAFLSTGRRRWFFAVASLLVLSTLGTTAFGEIPLNQRMFTWNAATPVPGWEAARASWLHFHWIKTGLSFVAFIVAATGLSRPLKNTA